jgi:dienelactone hydrolase
MRRSAAVIMLVVAVLMATPVRAAPKVAAENVEIPSGEAILKAVLFKPDGTGPFPALVGFHDCNGLLNGDGEVRERYRDWGEQLVAAGFAVVYPDSFATRGLKSQCSARERRARVSRDRIVDAKAARHWLQGKDWVKADRVALVGWGSGATSVLWTVRPRAAVKDDTPDFRSAVAFYPGCRRLSEIAWSARVPTLILVGANDDWNPPAACQAMIREARGRSAHAEIVTYPGAQHEFDHPNRPVTLRTGLAFSADGSGRAHVATHAKARADALKRVPEWLAR